MGNSGWMANRDGPWSDNSTVPTNQRRIWSAIPPRQIVGAGKSPNRRGTKQENPTRIISVSRYYIWLWMQFAWFLHHPILFLV